MSDNHFTYLHMTDAELRLLDDDEDADMLNEPLPEEDITVPAGLVPPLQEEEEESILPSASHPSYPYGNPYTLSLLPLRPAARSTKKGLKGNPHTRHMHTWTDLALEDLLPWEGEEPDLNYFAGLEAEGSAALPKSFAHAILIICLPNVPITTTAAAAAHAAAAAAAATGTDGEADGQGQAGQDNQPDQTMEDEQEQEASDENSEGIENSGG